MAHSLLLAEYRLGTNQSSSSCSFPPRNFTNFMDKGVSTDKGASSTPDLIKEPCFHVTANILFDFSAFLFMISEVLHFTKSDAPFFLGHAQFHCFPVQSLYPLVARLGEPANQAGSVFQGTVEWIIYVHYKNNRVSKYPSCGALLAHCNIFIMNSQLKKSYFPKPC